MKFFYNQWVILVLEELFYLAAGSWVVLLLVEFVKPGLVSNSYNLLLHLIITFLLFIGRLLISEKK
jgi:hypothetical protein